ncbi:MAG: MFS transporter [Muribaculaceae bacterium]|nr:MFS transporter [Muribaculaceae bacterium]
MNHFRELVHRYIAIVSILLVLTMTVLDGTLVNVALPILAREFHVSDSQSVWIVTIYQLVITMLLLPLSSLGDIYSYRRNFIIGILVFTVGSVFCALSPSLTYIVVSRAIQGVGAAFVMGVNVALIRLIYPPEMLGRGLAINAMTVAIATALGPTLGGTILSFTSWHWLFLINVPIGIIAFLMGFKYLPQNVKKDHRVSYDLVSGIANILTFGLLFFSLGNFSRNGDTVTNVILLVLGLVIGYFYIRHLHGREQPMFPVDLLKIKVYALSIMTSTSSFLAQNIAMISLPFLFLNGFGFSEINTGLLMTPWPIATMIVSPIAARLVERHNAGIIAAVGMLFFSCGVGLLMAASNANVSEWNIAWRMAICGVGFGLFQTPNNIVMIKTTPIERSGAAGGMQSTARLSGQTLGATVVTIVFALCSVPSDAGSLGNGAPGVRVSLILSICFSLLAGIFSISRIKSLPKILK